MGNSCKFSEIENKEISSESRKGSTEESQEESNYIDNKFQEIKEIRKEIAMMNVFKRKEIAKHEYKLLKSKNDLTHYIKAPDKGELKNKYITIMRLLLIDNTNKDIVKLYLDFIKNNSDFIIENGLMSYEKEINKYKILFSEDEMKKIEITKKNKSQKTIFLDYINKIRQEIKENVNSTKCKFIKESANKKLNNLFLFNTPIEFDNEELLYYKYYYNIIDGISKIDDDGIMDYLKNKQKVLEYIINKNLYNKKEITSNKDKMNLLLLYLMNENFDNVLKEGESINFNRLVQKMPVTKEDFYEYEKNSINILYTKEGKSIKLNTLNQTITLTNFEELANKNVDEIKKICEKKTKYIVKRSVNKFINGNYDALDIPLENACIQNLFNRNLEKKKEAIHFHNLETLMINNEISPYINDIKNFLLKLIDTNVYKQAIKKLFPDYYKCLDSNGNEDIKYYIKERIKFYPFQDLDISGITDKLSCSSFIPSINFTVLQTRSLKIRDENKDTYKIGLTIVNSTHEINHANQCIIFFKGNNKNLINSPKRNTENNLEVQEGGISLEYLLFGKIINEINLLECLYIMNEKNYEQDLDEFRKNFMNIRNLVKKSKGNTKFITIEEGIFKRFYENSIDEIDAIVKKLNIKINYFIPMMSIIEKHNKNKENEDNEYYIPPKKCGLMGGGKRPH